MDLFSDCKWGWSKEPQWENDCGSFLPCLLLVFMLLKLSFNMYVFCNWSFVVARTMIRASNTRGSILVVSGVIMNTEIIIWSIYSQTSNCSLCCVCLQVWRNQLCTCIVVGYIFENIYVVEHAKLGGLHYYKRLMGWVLRLLNIVWLYNLWVWVVWGLQKDVGSW